MDYDDQMYDRMADRGDYDPADDPWMYGIEFERPEALPVDENGIDEEEWIVEIGLGDRFLKDGRDIWETDVDYDINDILNSGSGDFFEWPGWGEPSASMLADWRFNCDIDSLRQGVNVSKIGDEIRNHEKELIANAELQLRYGVKDANAAISKITAALNHFGRSECTGVVASHYWHKVLQNWSTDDETFEAVRSVSYCAARLAAQGRDASASLIRLNSHVHNNQNLLVERLSREAFRAICEDHKNWWMKSLPPFVFGTLSAGAEYLFSKYEFLEDICGWMQHRLGVYGLDADMLLDNLLTKWSGSGSVLEFRGNESLKSFMLVGLRNEQRTWLNEESARRQREQQHFTEFPTAEDDVVGKAQCRETIQLFWSKLTPEQTAVLNAYLRGVEPGEFARAQGISERTYFRRLQEAKSQLQRLMDH